MASDKEFLKYSISEGAITISRFDINKIIYLLRVNTKFAVFSIFYTNNIW